MKVAVIGVGTMGRWLAEFSRDNLGDTMVADIDGRNAKRVAAELKLKFRSPSEAAADADLVIIAVPISKTVGVLRTTAKTMKRGAMLADVSSVKEEAVAAMKKIGGGLELASIHPLFGSGARTVEGKDFLLIPVKTGPIYKRLREKLDELGARVTELGAEEHDKLMGIIQCMRHFAMISYLVTLKSLKDFEKIKGLRTPISASLMNAAKASLTGSPELYIEIQAHNRHSKIIRRQMLESCHRLDAIFSAKDSKKMEKLFKELMNFIGPDEVQKAYTAVYKDFEGGAT